MGRLDAYSQATKIKGWKVGDDIRNLTSKGNVPKWDTVRQRYWKNRADWAKSTPGQKEYSMENIKRMENGLAPQKLNRETGKMESMELHRNPSQKNGGLFDVVEVWPEEHAKVDPSRKLGN